MKKLKRKIRRWSILILLGIIILAVAGCTGFNDPDPNTTPSQPTSISVTNITATEITLNWEPPTVLGDSVITKYQIQCNNDGWLDLPSTARSHTFTNLTPNTEYALSVRAVNDNGNGSTSERFVTTAN